MRAPCRRAARMASITSIVSPLWDSAITSAPSRDEVHEVGKFGAGRDGDSAPRDPCEQVLRGERGVAGAAHRRGHELLWA